MDGRENRAVMSDDDAAEPAAAPPEDAPPAATEKTEDAPPAVKAERADADDDGDDDDDDDDDAPGSPVPPGSPKAPSSSPPMADDDDDSDDDDGPVVARRRQRGAVTVDDDDDDSDDDDEDDKRRKKRKAMELDEDDYDLLEDNLVTGFTRKEKKKRIGKKSEKDKAAEKAAKKGGDKPKTMAEVERDLFGGSDDEELEEEDEDDDVSKEKKIKPAVVKDEKDFVDYDDEDSEDEFADFIEREEGEGPRPKKIKSHVPGVRSDQLQDAFDIFGDVGELQAMFAQRDRGDDEGDLGEGFDEESEYETDEEEDDGVALEDEGDDALDRPDKKKKRRRRRKTSARSAAAGRPGRGSWLHAFEPSVVREQMLTAKDDEIRETDWPERMQLDARVTPFKKEDAAAEAKWILDRLMGVGSVRDAPTFGGELLLRGWADDESQDEHEDRVRNIEENERGNLPKEEAEAAEAAIADLLCMTHLEGLEIAFIAQNLKDRVAPLLRGRRDDSRPPPRDSNLAVLERRVHRRDVLHEVLEWDKRHARMTRRKAELLRKFGGVVEVLGDDHPDLDELAALMNKCEDARAEETLDDVEAKLTLRFDEEIHQFLTSEAKGGIKKSGAESTHVRPLNRTAYAHHRKKGLRDLLPMYGATPAALAQSLNSYRRNAGTENQVVPDMMPEDAASVYVGEETGYGDVSVVLKALTHVAAAELSVEPSVRAWMRVVVRRKAQVWTQPTPKGTIEIDPFHPLARVKRLQNKPISEFTGTEFAAVLRAYDEGLITLRVALPEKVIDDVMAEAEQAYLLEDVSEIADAWNALRKDALHLGLKKHLAVSLTKSATVLLAREAIAEVKRECGEALWPKISNRPWAPEIKSTEEYHDDEVDVRVLAAVWGPGTPATTFAMLDAEGELVDFLECPNIAVRAAGPFAGQSAAGQRRDADMNRLVQFMIEHRPHVVAVAASSNAGMNCKFLREAARQAVEKIVEDHARAIPEEVNTIDVHFVDDTIPALAGASAAMREELREHKEEVRHATCVGRYLRNPAGIVAALASGGEAASLTLSTLQDALTEDERLAVFTRALADVVNQVGVDVNACVAHPWQQKALNYVAGLGARKAAAVVAAVRASDGGALETRAELVYELGIVGPIVFRNAASSLRVVDDDILDATRIHPERYAQTFEIIANALDYDLEQLKKASKAVQRKTVERALDPEHWEKFAELDLRAYAEYLHGEGQGWIYQTLREVRVELHEPYGDIRGPWEPPTALEEFALLTGETEHSMCEGKIVQCTVKKLVRPNPTMGINAEVLVSLESGVTGKIQKEDLSDNHVNRLEDKVAVGQVISARVKPNGIDYEAGVVHLACAGSVLSREATQQWEAEKWGRTPYYSLQVMDGEIPKPKKKKRQASRPSFIHRNINHPLFQNVTALQAQEILKTQDIGEVLLRPSSKGVTHLSLTVKFYDDMYVHHDIKEGKKPGVGHTANLALGSPLTVDGVEYEDLDEVYARHVEPMVTNLKAMIRHRKFRRGTKRDVDQRLKAEMARHPDTRPYALSVSFEHHGVFCLSSILSKSGNVHHEYISVKPEGFRFRRMEFPTVDRMLAYFKVNPRAPVAAPAVEPPREEPRYDAYPPSQWQQQQPPPPMQSQWQQPPPQYQQYQPPPQYNQPPPAPPGGGWGAPPVHAYQGAPPPMPGAPPPMQPPYHQQQQYQRY